VKREPGVEVQVNVGAFPDAPTALLEKAVRWTLAAEGRDTAEISLTLVGDTAIKELNRSYLGKNRPTDVISFSLRDSAEPLGDIYVGAQEASRQAEEAGVSLVEELVRLAVHGTLHVLGYDHPKGPERTRSPMFERQETLVREILAAGRQAAEG
jgi:probable rRNA maturation factor